MPGSYEVEPDDLVAHASHLDGLVDRLDSVQQAADYAMSDDAYGLLCSFLPPIISPTGEKAKEAIVASSEGVQTISDNVRKASDGYREAEHASKDPLEKKQKALEGMNVTPAMHGVKQKQAPENSLHPKQAPEN